eukprot:m.130474 g.130474  ORF g.130474 m.130474 type:complete len:57 (+) comp38028_c0_seq4:781-951(+)
MTYEGTGPPSMATEAGGIAYKYFVRIEIKLPLWVQFVWGGCLFSGMIFKLSFYTLV